jgi:hypothetical protein
LSFGFNQDKDARMQLNRKPILYRIVIRSFIACLLIAGVPSTSTAGPLADCIGKGVDKMAASIKKVKAKAEAMKPKGRLKKAFKNKMGSKGFMKKRNPCSQGSNRYSNAPGGCNRCYN